MGIKRNVSIGRPGFYAEVNRPGLGCMTMTHAYEKADPKDGLETLSAAAKMGCTFWDTAASYANGDNERLIGQALKQLNREDIFLCTKCGVDFTDSSHLGPHPTALDRKFTTNGSPEAIRRGVLDSLDRLGTDYIDLLTIQRIDTSIPIEETMGEMKKLVEEKVVRFIGLSECSAETLRRACKVFPVSAVQTEYSAWTTDLEHNGVLDACRELGVVVVAYSPLGRGMFTGTLESSADIPSDDLFRKTNPRFEKKAFNHNHKLVEEFKKMAAEKGCTTGQLALAWVMYQGDDILPIPGTKHVKYLKENWNACDVNLSQDELKRIRKIIDSFPVEGDRYAAPFMAQLNK